MISAVPIGPYVWITGYHVKNGVIWILDKNFKLLNTIDTSHQGVIYSVLEIGNLIWTYSNDKKIITWKTQDFKTLTEFVSIELDHRDSVTCMIAQHHKEGFTLWSGSADKTINVHFIASNYAEYYQPKKLLRTVAVNKRAPHRGPLKRSTTIATSTDSGYYSEDLPATPSIVLDASTEDSPSLRGKLTESRRALFAKGRTPSGSVRSKKVTVPQHGDDPTPPQTITLISRDGTLPITRSKFKKTQTNFVRRSETKREKTPSTEGNDSIQ